MRYVITMLAALLLAYPASAERWGGGNALGPDPGQSGARTYTWSGSGSVANSDFLSVGACGLIQVIYEDDVRSGGDTTAAATLTRYKEPDVNAASTDVALTSATTITLTTGDYPHLRVHTITNTGETTSKARVTVQCQEAFATGDVAPGVVGSTATPETINFIADLQGVPFPEKLEPHDGSEWTDYYFSAEAGGDYPLGDDSNDGLSPQKPKLTWEHARDICLGGAYRRCNFDRLDEWTVGNGGVATNWGIVTDSETTPGICLLLPNLQALEKPCWWVRSSPGGGQATITSTGTSDTAEFLAMKTVDDRAVLLFENLALNCDSATNGSSPCFDTFKGSGIIGVANTFVVSDADLNSATGNVTGCHDVGITHNYATDASFAGGGSFVTGGITVGTQDVCTYVHIGGEVKSDPDTASSAGIWQVAQSPATDGSADSVPSDAELIAERLVIPRYTFVGGVTSRIIEYGSGNTNERYHMFIDSEAHDGANGRINSGENRAAFVMSKFINDVSAQGNGAGSAHYGLRVGQMGADTTLDFRSIMNTWGTVENTGVPAGYYHIVMPNAVVCPSGDPNGSVAEDCDTAADPDFDYLFVGDIFEPLGVNNVLQRFLSSDEEFWTQMGGTLTLQDISWPTQLGGAFSWRHETTGDTNLTGNSPSDWLTVWAGGGEDTGQFSFTNVSDAFTADDSGTASGAGTTTTLVDTGNFTGDTFAGCFVQVNSVVNTEDVTRRIASHNNDTLTWDNAVLDATDSGEAYEIYCITEPTTLMCYAGGNCEDNNDNTPSNYVWEFSPRGYIPAFIAGRTLTRFDGKPVTFTDNGIPELP